MKSDKRHDLYMNFTSTLVNLVSGLSVEDFAYLRKRAIVGFPALVPIIDACLQVYFPSTKSLSKPVAIAKVAKVKSFSEGDQHLFDLLRSKRLFPSNSDLATFAARILPGMAKRRFDKMSRADIAGRVIEYIETQSPSKRLSLEQAMRNAMFVGESEASRKSFFSQWEKIIKGN